MVADIVAVPVLVVTLGVACLYIGWKQRGVHALLTDVDRTPVGRIDAPGTVEVSGTAVASEESFEAPVTGRDAVAAAWTVEEWDERGDTSTWREVARGIEIAPFAVEDHTGTLRVGGVSKRDTAGKWTQTTGVSAADGVRIGHVLAEFEAFPVQRELEPDEEPSAEIESLHRDHGLYEDTGSVTNVADVGTEHGTRRYAEQVIAPGDDVYVLGHVESRGGTDRARLRPQDARLTTPAEGLMIISDQDAEALEAEFAAAYRGTIYVGLSLLVAGLGLLAAFLLWL